MSITCDRRKLVNFSAEYFSAKQRILATRDSDVRRPADLSGKRVCVVKATTSKARLQRITPPPVLVEAVTWADCLVALQQRQADAVSTDDAILAGLVAQDPYLHIVGPNMAEEPYGIGINLSNTGLRAVRQRDVGADSPRRHVEHVVPQVVDRARLDAEPTRTEVQRLMPDSEATTGPVEAGPVDAGPVDAGPDTDPGTQAVR